MDISQTSFTLGDKEYLVDVNAFSLEETRKLVGLDLLNCFKDQTVFDRIHETGALIDALWIFCEDSRNRYDVTDEKEFAKLFKDQDALSEAAGCVINGLMNFFQSHQRIPLQKLMSNSRKAESKLKERAAEMFSTTGMDEKIESMIDRQVTKFEKEFTSALESLESEMRDGEHSGS